MSPTRGSSARLSCRARRGRRRCVSPTARKYPQGPRKLRGKARPTAIASDGVIRRRSRPAAHRGIRLPGLLHHLPGASGLSRRRNRRRRALARSQPPPPRDNPRRLSDRRALGIGPPGDPADARAGVELDRGLDRSRRPCSRLTAYGGLRSTRTPAALIPRRSPSPHFLTRTEGFRRQRPPPEACAGLLGVRSRSQVGRPPRTPPPGSDFEGGAPRARTAARIVQARGGGGGGWRGTCSRVSHHGVVHPGPLRRCTRPRRFLAAVPYYRFRTSGMHSFTFSAAYFSGGFLRDEKIE